MGKDNGFATFLSDELPGFESLNGSAFFDQAHDWDAGFSDDDDDDSSSEDPAHEGGFEIVRSAAQQVKEAKKEVLFFDSEDDNGVDDNDDKTMEAMDLLLASKKGGRVPRSSRGDQERRPLTKDHKKKPSDGKSIKVRRTKTTSEPTKDESSHGGPQVRRVKTSQGTTRTMRRPTSSKRPEKRGERKSSPEKREERKSSGLDLGAKLNNLAPNPTDPKAFSRRSSNRELGVSDEVSVVSRGVQSCAGLSVGRRDARRRRATQGHALLARNLQHYDLAGADEEIVKKSTQPSKVDERRRQRRQQQPLSIAA